MSFLTANSDPEQYGQMNAFTMPQGQTVLGPVQVNNQIIRTATISTAITLLNQQGSQVIQGSMQLIPIGNSIIYVRPFYAQGSGEGSYPLFQFVVVFSQDYGAYCGQNVQDALDQMLAQHGEPPAACRRRTSDHRQHHDHHHDHAGHRDHHARHHRARPPRPSRRRPAARRTCSTRRPRTSTTPRRRSRPATSASTSGS